MGTPAAIAIASGVWSVSDGITDAGVSAVPHGTIVPSATLSCIMIEVSDWPIWVHTVI